jgi:hypothetical protein
MDESSEHTAPAQENTPVVREADLDETDQNWLFHLRLQTTDAKKRINTRRAERGQEPL